MGVTTYYSVGGEIIGERSGGFRTDYLRDALGSVTATKRTDRSTLSNTYRYKPYGERLAKTGVAADPRFQWVGTAGYRETAISHSKSYVRARHLGQEEGRWTTVDPIWPREQSYGYAISRPSCVYDPTGLIELTFEDTVCFHEKCKLTRWAGCWRMPKGRTGWIVQHIITDGMYFECCPPIPHNHPLADNFWEAWRVLDGYVCRGLDCGGVAGLCRSAGTIGFDDYSFDRFLAPSFGFFFAIGKARFYSDQELSGLTTPASWTITPDKVRIRTHIKPSWWNPADKAEWINRMATTTWNCCNDKELTSTFAYHLAPYANWMRLSVPNCP